jgi:hypothetical protein
MLLDPPLPAGVLSHMASFQAAIQIITPMDDNAWEVLKPRLLSQREEAEQRENDRIAQTRVVLERFQDNQARSDSKDLVDREWDDIQAPLRVRIGGYADEIIRDGWNGGEKVSYDTCPLFASEVLIYIRKRFYAEVAKDEAAVRATGHEPEIDPPNGPYTRKLILENMKWVFDTKIKPHTENYRKELFLCNACEYTSKYYGFEGVIQHFAAKHTSALSHGSIVVHWKSEWPEYPPFHPDPTNVSPAPYYSAPPSASVPYVTNGSSMPQSYGYGGYQSTPVSAPMPAPNTHGYQESPGPYYGHPQFGDQYSGHQNGPYAPPPQTYQDVSQGYQASQYSIPPLSTNVPGYDAPQGYSQQGYNGQYQPVDQNTYQPAQQGGMYQAAVPEQSAYAQAPNQYGQPYSQPPAYQPNTFTQGPPQRTEAYMAQLQSVARNAREIWNSIGGLKEAPGSLKVYTIIFHLLARFHEDYQEDLPLAMMVDGLSNNKDMRPVRNINGLLCKACSLGMAGAASAPQKKRFSFPQLVNHFRSAHELGVPQDNIGHIPDWTKDMLDLPDMSRLASIFSAHGMDDKKLKLFTEALPGLITAPSPAVAHAMNGSDTQYDHAPPNQYAELAPSQDNHLKYYTAPDGDIPSESGSVTYDSGEYDPRHPGNLPKESRPLRRASRGDLHSRGWEDPIYDSQPPPRLIRAEDVYQQAPYQELQTRTYAEHRPRSPLPHARHSDDYERVVVREEARRYVEYRDDGEVDHRIRHPPPGAIIYDEPDVAYSVRDYRTENSHAYQSNRQDLPPRVLYEAGPPASVQRPLDDPTTQQHRIFDVVAQISQQAQQAREHLPAKEQPVEAGSEDGEVRVDSVSKIDNTCPHLVDESNNSAERFLNQIVPGESAEGPRRRVEEVEHRKESTHGTQWSGEQGQSTSAAYQLPPESAHRMREPYEQVRPSSSGRLQAMDVTPRNGYIVHGKTPPPRQSRAYAYDDGYAGPLPGQIVQRERSPELVDRRYKLNNVVYHEERQGSHGTHRTPSRYARYESVRLENDRARSRSPAYVRVGPPSTQYLERSPRPQALRHEPIYRARTPPPAVEEVAYERAPRQEYCRVDPRPREPQYEEAFEYVRVSDLQGDYMIRRPVARREPERIYAAYDDEVYSRPLVYESRAPAPGADPPVYEEEYDPRKPAAPPELVRQIRYQ